MAGLTPPPSSAVYRKKRGGPRLCRTAVQLLCRVPQPKNRVSPCRAQRSDPGQRGFHRGVFRKRFSWFFLPPWRWTGAVPFPCCRIKASIPLRKKDGETAFAVVQRPASHQLPSWWSFPSEKGLVFHPLGSRSAPPGSLFELHDIDAAASFRVTRTLISIDEEAEAVAHWISSRENQQAGGGPELPATADREPRQPLRRQRGDPRGAGRWT